jgi:hypothetical protein
MRRGDKKPFGRNIHALAEVLGHVIVGLMKYEKTDVVEREAAARRRPFTLAGTASSVNASTSGPFM